MSWFQSFILACPIRAPKRVESELPGQGLPSENQGEAPPSPSEDRIWDKERWGRLTGPRTQDVGEIRERHFSILEGVKKVETLLRQAEGTTATQERLFILLRVRALVEALNTVQTRSEAYDADVSGYPALSRSTDAVIHNARRTYIESVKRWVAADEDRLSLIRPLPEYLTELAPGDLDGTIQDAVGRLAVLTQERSFNPPNGGESKL